MRKTMGKDSRERLKIPCRLFLGMQGIVERDHIVFNVYGVKEGFQCWDFIGFLVNGTLGNCRKI